MVQAPSERVAENLRAVLARRRISGRVFSQMVGWTTTSGARRLSGEQPMTLDEVVRVAAVLGITIADMFDGVVAELPADEQQLREPAEASA